MKKSFADRIFDIVNVAIILILAVIMIYPLYFIVIASFSEPYATVSGSVVLTPVGFTLEAYRNVLRESSVWVGYRNSILYTVFGTAYNLVLTIPAAYVLSKKNLPLHTPISWFFFITMYFSGGLIPTYLLMKNLGLLNTPYVLILGAGVSCYNLIVSRQFFSSTIPDDIYEAASIDGASDWRTFFQIALPLSSSIIAVMALYYAVAHWNSYYNALIYITDHELFPLQLVLRNILILNQTAVADVSGMDMDEIALAARRTYMAEAMKYALIFIASAPMMILYPFVQRFFVKGVMIGSVKG